MTPGPHAHKIGSSEYCDEVFVKADPDASVPVVDVIREEGPHLIGLTAEQAFAVAGILLDGSHMDKKLAPLLMDASDLITRQPPRPRFAALRAIFRRPRP
jgi:hypothetical protein